LEGIYTKNLATLFAILLILPTSSGITDLDDNIIYVDDENVDWFPLVDAVDINARQEQSHGQLWFRIVINLFKDILDKLEGEIL